MTDPIADMLTRIRNAVQSRHQRVDIPASKLKLEIARILENEGYIGGFKVVDNRDAPSSPQQVLRLTSSTARAVSASSPASSASAALVVACTSAAKACRWCSAGWAPPS